MPLTIIMEKKITFQDSRGTKLVGMLHLPKEKTNSAVIISHGFAANKDRTRLIKLAETLSKNGFAVLRFDFGGCGESEDREITLKNQVDDLKSAINYVRKNGYSNIGLLGESLGGLTSILAYDDEIKTLVLWAPVTKSKTPSIIQKEELQRELSERGFIIYQKNGRKFRIPKEYLEERHAVNQKAVLSKIKSPVLIIHGDKDDTVPLEQSKEAVQFLPEDSKLEIIKDGDHKLDDKMSEVISSSVNWFKKYLAPK
jgi:alpha-beta hydrolase superfamily lysophospholipase